MSAGGSGGHVLPNKRRKFFPQQLIEQPSAAAMLLAGRTSDMSQAAHFGPQPGHGYHTSPGFAAPVGLAGSHQMLRPMMGPQLFSMGAAPGQYMNGPRPPAMQGFLVQQPMDAQQQQQQLLLRRGGRGHAWGVPMRGGAHGLHNHAARAMNGHLPQPQQPLPAQQQPPAQQQYVVQEQPQPQPQQQQQPRPPQEQVPHALPQAGPPSTVAVAQAGCARAAAAQPRASAHTAPEPASASPAAADPFHVLALRTVQALSNGMPDTAAKPVSQTPPVPSPSVLLEVQPAQAPATNGQASDPAAKAGAPNPADVSHALQPGGQEGPQDEQVRTTGDGAASSTAVADPAAAGAGEAAQAAEAFLNTMSPPSVPRPQVPGKAAAAVREGIALHFTQAAGGDNTDTDDMRKEPEAEGEPEKERTLADVLIWRCGEWKGPSPREHLLDWSMRNGLPRPCYEVLRSAKAATAYHATCILPQSGIQITPVAAFPTPEDAEQNAALFAIVHAEGGFSDSASAHCAVTQVGTPALPGWTPVPALLPDQGALQRLLDERMDRLTVQMGALHREYLMRKAVLEAELEAAAEQSAALAKGGSRAQAVIEALQGLSPEEVTMGTSVTSVSAKRAKLVVQAQPKGPVQELKERCEKAHWRAPSYEFVPFVDGKGFVCRLSLPEAGIRGMSSKAHPNQKAAKAEAAAQCLAALRAAHMAE